MFLSKLNIIAKTRAASLSGLVKPRFYSGSGVASEPFMQHESESTTETAATESSETEFKSRFPVAEPGTKLFVGNLATEVTDTMLQETFGSYGTVKEASVVMNKFNGQPRGFAFVTFETVEDAETAMNTLNNTEFQGRNLLIKVSENRPPFKPRGNYGYNSGYQNRQFYSPNSSYRYKSNSSYSGSKQSRYPAYGNRSSSNSYYGSNRQGYYQNSKYNNNYSRQDSS